MELYDYTPEGEPILKSENELALPLSTRVQRLWATHPDFSALTEANAVSGPSKTSKEDEEDDANESKPPGEMSAEQCQELKESMIQKLGTAHNELFFLLNVINATVPLQLRPNEAPPPLPLGAAGETIKASSLGKAALPPPTLPVLAHDASLSIARKSSAISKASQSLAAASERLKTTAEQSTQDWRGFTQWKRAGWNLQTRGSGPGASLGSAKGLEQCAKELVAVVACEESPAPLRSTVAYLKQDQQVDMVQLKHGKRRMVCRYAPPSSDHTQIYVTPDEGLDLMRQGQVELFEEDLFREVMKEAQRHQPSGSSAEERLFRGSTSQHAVNADLLVGGQLSIEMVPRDQLPKEEEEGSDTRIYARIASALLRLRMATVMQHRRRMAASPAPTTLPMPPAQAQQSQQTKTPSVLLWVVDLFNALLHVHRLRQHMPDSDLFISPLRDEAALLQALDGSPGTSPAAVGGEAEAARLGALFSGSITNNSKAGLQVIWSGADAWVSGGHGHIPLHTSSQLRDLLDVHLQGQSHDS